MTNATFYSFKSNDRPHMTERGNVPRSIYDNYSQVDIRKAILSNNGGKVPATDGDGLWLTIIIIPDDSEQAIFPIMIRPETNY